MSVFGVILVRIQSEYGKIPIRITPNKSTFHAVNGLGFQHASIRTYSMEDSSKAYLVRSQCFTVLTFFAVGVNMIYFSKSSFIKIGYLRFVYVSIATPLIYELLRHWSPLVTVEQSLHIAILSLILTVFLHFGHLYCSSKLGRFRSLLVESYIIVIFTWFFWCTIRSLLIINYFGIFFPN